MLCIAGPIFSHLKLCEVTGLDFQYCQTSNISHNLVGNKIVDHCDLFGASPAPTTSSFSIEQRQLHNEKRNI